MHSGVAWRIRLFLWNFSGHKLQYLLLDVLYLCLCFHLLMLEEEDLDFIICKMCDDPWQSSLLATGRKGNSEQSRV